MNFQHPTKPSPTPQLLEDGCCLKPKSVWHLAPPPPPQQKSLHPKLKPNQPLWGTWDQRRWQWSARVLDEFSRVPGDPGLGSELLLRHFDSLNPEMAQGDILTCANSSFERAHIWGSILSSGLPTVWTPAYLAARVQGRASCATVLRWCFRGSANTGPASFGRSLGKPFLLCGLHFRLRSWQVSYSNFTQKATRAAFKMGIA